MSRYNNGNRYNIAIQLACDKYHDIAIGFLHHIVLCLDSYFVVTIPASFHPQEHINIGDGDCALVMGSWLAE